MLKLPPNAAPGTPRVAKGALDQRQASSPPKRHSRNIKEALLVNQPKIDGDLPLPRRNQTKLPQRDIIDILLADEPKIEDMMIPSRHEYAANDKDTNPAN